MDSTARNTHVDASGAQLLRLGMDTRLLVVTLLLMAIGLSLVLSSSSYFAGGKFGDHFALMRNHAGRCVVALVVMFLASRVDYRVYRRTAPMLLLVGVLLMIGVFVFGVTIRDTRRWYPAAAHQHDAAAFGDRAHRAGVLPRVLGDAHRPRLSLHSGAASCLRPRPSRWWPVSSR